MTKTRLKRGAWVLLTLLLAGAAVALMSIAFKQNLLYYYTPTQFVEAGYPATQDVRVGGLVKPCSVDKLNDGITTEFIVFDNTHEITVVFKGVLPDLFAENEGVVAKGLWRNNKLISDEVLAKHDEEYRPPNTESMQSLQGEQTEC